MTQLFAQFTQGFLDYGWRILYASMILLGLELLFGHGKYSLGSRLRGALFWVVYILITVAFFTVFNTLWAKLGVKPLLTWDLKGATDSVAAYNIMMWVVTPILAALIGDFFYYWFHRLQHSNRFMWAFHSEHHAIREMSAWNSTHHVTEEIFRIPLVVLPATLLVHVEHGYVPAIIWLLLGVHGQFVHSNTRLNLGPLRYIVADNRYHRIHHSVEQRHFNTNFGSFTSLWDVVFGTACFPKRNEWPATGIDEHDEAKTVKEFLFRPLGKVRGMARSLFAQGSAH